MGTDKAFLEFNGRTLLANALELGRTVAEQAWIVGDPTKFAKCGTVIEDIYPGRGPLGGIHAALKSSDTELNLMIGVDLPLLEARFLRYLIECAVQSGAVVTVPRVGRHFEPLCAAYGKELLLPAEQALIAGRNKIDALFESVRIRIVEDEELAQHHFSSEMFRNVNTPEDWKLAQERIRTAQHV